MLCRKTTRNRKSHMRLSWPRCRVRSALSHIKLWPSSLPHSNSKKSATQPNQSNYRISNTSSSKWPLWTRTNKIIATCFRRCSLKQRFQQLFRHRTIGPFLLSAMATTCLKCNRMLRLYRANSHPGIKTYSNSKSIYSNTNWKSFGIRLWTRETQ